ncbi:hypothetical protein BpHYR1_028391 [Brachionus plicatilis]|uniref:Uncharacterized protein n=1 Tax=Brachionus plicatilis TaxID=10195 RepID=A0A3M7P477_BRAPC|nr:hypothetical protein BpHYR1_028391 [Brachionus plicatilis]
MNEHNLSLNFTVNENSKELSKLLVVSNSLALLSVLIDNFCILIVIKSKKKLALNESWILISLTF